MDSSSPTKPIHDLQEKIFDIKHKITSQEYLALMNLTGKIFKNTVQTPSSDDDDDDEEDEHFINLSVDMLITIGDIQYYKVSCEGWIDSEGEFDNVLFSYPEGKFVGGLLQDNITIVVRDEEEEGDAICVTVGYYWDIRTVNQTNELFTPPDVVDPAWRDNLRIGSLVDVHDPYGNWYEAIVVNAFGPLNPVQPGGIRIHYRGWEGRYNENFPRDSVRIAPPFTFVDNWRKNAKIGDIIEAKIPDGTKWFLATINTIDIVNIGTPNNPLIGFSFCDHHNNIHRFEN